MFRLKPFSEEWNTYLAALIAVLLALVVGWSWMSRSARPRSSVYEISYQHPDMVRYQGQGWTVFSFLMELHRKSPDGAELVLTPEGDACTVGQYDSFRTQAMELGVRRISIAAPGGNRIQMFDRLSMPGPEARARYFYLDERTRIFETDRDYAEFWSPSTGTGSGSGEEGYWVLKAHPAAEMSGLFAFAAMVEEQGRLRFTRLLNPEE